MGSPQFDQKVIEVHQFPVEQIPNQVTCDGFGGIDSDFYLSEVQELEGLECIGDPLDALHVRPNLNALEVYGIGQVKHRRLPGCAQSCGGGKGCSSAAEAEPRRTYTWGSNGLEEIPGYWNTSTPDPAPTRYLQPDMTPRFGKIEAHVGGAKTEV